MKTIKNEINYRQTYGNQKGLLLYDFKNSVENTFETHLIPRQLYGGGIFICLQGETEFVLDLKVHKLKKGDMCIIFPFSILQTVHQSDDFDKFLLGISIELIDDIQLPSLTEYYLYIKENPCISLSDEEKKMLLELCELMIQKYTFTSHPFRQEIVKSLFKVIYYEIAAIYKKHNPIMHESIPRKDMLVRKFMYLLTKHYHKHRAVKYYAGELCVTPRYLSSVIKEKTNSGALFWVNNLVIKQAKNLLNDNSLSVLQISDKLSFSNPSFFGQYFKKHTGMTPKKFRDKET
jgi:AraC-like DNA-binding protein